MYRIRYYKDKNGNSDIKDYIEGLRNSKNKDSRIRLQKIQDYMKFLKIEGKQAGEPYVKHLDGEIWELRPLRDRILFAAWDGKQFILLHHFFKRTRKTPPREIKQAKRNMADIRERGLNDEE